jgi:hypothetical protein
MPQLVKEVKGGIPLSPKGDSLLPPFSMMEQLEPKEPQLPETEEGDTSVAETDIPREETLLGDLLPEMPPEDPEVPPEDDDVPPAEDNETEPDPPCPCPCPCPCEEE